MKHTTKHRSIGLAVLLLLALVVAETSWADVTPEPGGELALEARVVASSRQLRLAISVASFAVSAPAIRDVRVHAQQLINLLEGAAGRHYAQAAGTDPVLVGLVSEVTSWTARFSEVTVEPEVHARVVAAARNVRAYLMLALDAALSILSERRFDVASTDMLRVYAYLAAAYEQPTGAAAIPALGTILRELGIDLQDEAS